MSQIIPEKICSLSKSRLSEILSNQNKMSLGGIGFGGLFSVLCEKYELPSVWKAQDYMEDKQTLAWGHLNVKT